ncbi:MAG: hypothetical protein KDD03_13195 [Gelidibacter sp.]|nr:hypothetical protein [Gelidibacter sp.]
MIAYKLVGTDMKSLTFGASSRKLDIFYKPYKWVRPLNKHAPLMVFKSEESARSFVKCYPYSINENCYLYSCKIKKSRKMWGPNTDLKEVLKAKKTKKRFSHLLKPMLSGSILADEVMLLERIR